MIRFQPIRHARRGMLAFVGAASLVGCSGATPEARISNLVGGGPLSSDAAVSIGCLWTADVEQPPLAASPPAATYDLKEMAADRDGMPLKPLPTTVSMDVPHESANSAAATLCSGVDDNSSASYSAWYAGPITYIDGLDDVSLDTSVSGDLAATIRDSWRQAACERSFQTGGAFTADMLCADTPSLLWPSAGSATDTTTDRGIAF